MLIRKTVSVIIFALVSQSALALGKDSTKVKSPKHYIKPTIYSSYYHSPKREAKNGRYGNYSFSELNVGFYVPLFTKDYHLDSNVISNLHLLLIGNYQSATPKFDSIATTHQLIKVGAGLRLIYNNGKKNVWFFNAFPFRTQDKESKYKPIKRYASVLIFNRTVSEKFSWRVGITKTFLLGDRFTLPIIGFRIGRLDGIYLNMMLPRNISLNFPIGKNFAFSAYTKPLGGIYTFANSDSIYNGRDSLLHFGRREINSGISIEFSPNQNFALKIGSGITTNNTVAFSSTKFNRENKFQSFSPFYRDDLKSSFFITGGITIRFGKSKKIYNNYTMYDLIDLNNQFDPGDSNDGPSNNNIPKKGTDVKNLKYKDVEDLLDLEDTY
jgi:hypothetical protein